jgi:hypothetical protein
MKFPYEEEFRVPSLEKDGGLFKKRRSVLPQTPKHLVRKVPTFLLEELHTGTSPQRLEFQSV